MGIQEPRRGGNVPKVIQVEITLAINQRHIKTDYRQELATDSPGRWPQLRWLPALSHPLIVLHERLILSNTMSSGYHLWTIINLKS